MDSDGLFFFFMDEQDMPVQLQETGVKGQRRLWQQGFWVSERCIIPHRLWSMCLCDPSPWFSCWPSKWQRNPTWKCHCIDCLRCGTAHSRCGEDGWGQGQQTSCLASWMLCVSFLFTLKLCVQPLSLPTGWTSISLQKNTEKGESKKHIVWALMAGSSMET